MTQPWLDVLPSSPTLACGKTTVLLCGDLFGPETGFDAADLRSSLEATMRDVAVQVVPDLCDRPNDLSHISAPSSGVVLGLCSSDYPEMELQKQARKAGLDPLGLEVVPLGSLCAGVHPWTEARDKAVALLSTAVARSRSYGGSGPEHSRPVFLRLSQRVSRRSLFTLSPVVYHPAPAVNGDRCAAGSGCRLCIRACPREALSCSQSRVSVDKMRCEGCGVCVTACPRGAVYMPGSSLEQFAAQMGALVEAAARSQEPVGLLFLCRKNLPKLEALSRAGDSYSSRWLPVVLPCLGMMTPSWALQAVARGCASIGLLSCQRECALRQQGSISGRARFSADLVRRLGSDGERVHIVGPSDPGALLRFLQGPPRPGQEIRRLATPVRLDPLPAAAEAIEWLAGNSAPGAGARLESPHSPFALLKMREEACTMCLSCISACPTGALTSADSDVTTAISFRHSLCNGCGLCVDACPEGDPPALEVSMVTDVAALSRRPVTLHEDRWAVCRSCGARICSTSLAHRLDRRLEKDDERLRSALTQYCPECRLFQSAGSAALDR